MPPAIQAPQTFIARQLVHVLTDAFDVITAWRARRREMAAIRHLRRYDPHLVTDIDLDAEALWQPRPHIRSLHTAFARAAGVRQGADKA